MTHQEVERTFDVGPDFEMPALSLSPDVRSADEPAELRLEAVYFDTDDYHLARRGVTLRHRTGGTDDGWHLKRPSAPGVRTELRVPLTPEQAGPPATFDDELRALVRGHPVRPVVRIVTRRVERPVKSSDGRTLAVVADDHVCAQASLDTPAEHQRWREVEIELVDGPEETLDLLERTLLAHGARSSPGTSKLTRALAGRVPNVRPTGAWSEVATYAQAQRDAIVSLDPAVRRDEADGVHKMRVACRRLRSTLRTFRAAFDTDRSEPLRQELRWLAGELGRSRDAEVMAAALREQVAAEPTELVIGPVVAQIGARFAGEAQQGRQQVLTALDSARYAELLEAMDEVVDAPPTIDVTASELRRMARRSLRRVDRRLSRASHIPAVVPPAQRLQPPLPGVVADRATQLHEARKAAKRARYAAEALRTSGGKPARRLIKALKRLQDQLGVYQDSVLTRQVLRELGVTAYLDGQNAFTYGLLHARQQNAAERAEREIPAASKKMRRGKARDWLG